MHALYAELNRHIDTFDCTLENNVFCITICLFICNGRKALLLLKKKRYQDQLLDKTENQISNLERMVSFVISHYLMPSHFLCHQGLAHWLQCDLIEYNGN